MYDVETSSFPRFKDENENDSWMNKIHCQN